MNRSPLILSLVSLTALCAAQAASAAEPLCASPAQRAAVAAAFSRPNPPAPFSAARELKMPEAVIMSALPAAQAHGVAATHFQTVWKSLETWEKSVFVVMKGGHVFEAYGKVFAGEPSKRSNFFNLHGEGAGMSGHLRPDLISHIYVIAVPGKDAVTRGVLFYDAQGEAAFGVYLPGEGTPPTAAQIAQFEDTAAEIRALPGVCSGEAATP